MNILSTSVQMPSSTEAGEAGGGGGRAAGANPERGGRRNCGERASPPNPTPHPNEKIHICGDSALQ